MLTAHQIVVAVNQIKEASVQRRLAGRLLLRLLLLLLVVVVMLLLLLLLLLLHPVLLRALRR